MTLTYTNAEVLSLKGNAQFSERWVQERIVENPAILGLGDVDVVAVEKVQHRAGRLDLLLHDEQLNRRYEVELMLGATDPSHIIRCIEYYDIERRRYPAYDHVAVLVAEDITSRFLNVMALLSGSIPLIALQATALKVEDKVVLHFARVLDQTALRSDDAYEENDNDIVEANREWWERKVPPKILGMCDEACRLVNETSSARHELQYRKQLINIRREDGTLPGIWLWPKKTLLNVAAYVPHPADWAKRFEDLGASLRRGNKAVRVPLTPTTFEAHREVLRDFLRDAVSEPNAD